MLGRLFSPVFLLLLFVLPCVAQSPDQPASPPSAPASTSPAPDAPPAKKVWTNEDIPSVKPVTQPVDKRKQPSQVVAKGPVDAATVEKARKSIEKLQAQLDDVNKKIKAYKDFLAGEPVSSDGRDLSKGVNRTPVDQQLLQLEDKKQKLESQISELYDDARKRGITSNQLP
jgi:hypothetical protein